MSHRIVYLFCCLLFVLFASTASNCLAGTTKALGVAAAGGVQTEAQSPAVEEDPVQAEASSSLGGMVATWLHLFDRNAAGGGEETASGILEFFPKVPGDIYHSLKASGGDMGLWGVILTAVLSLVAIGGGYLAMFVVRKSFAGGFERLTSTRPHDGEAWSKITVALLHLIPKLLELLVLAVGATVLFLVIAGLLELQNSMVFQLLLGTALVTRLLLMLTRTLFSPDDEKSRIITLRAPLVQPVATLVYTTFSFLFVAVFIIRFIKELGVQDQTHAWMLMICGSLFMIPICYQLFGMKKEVQEALQENVEEDSLVKQIAEHWLLPVFFYLFICWFVWIGREITGTSLRNGSFILSVLIVPGYLAVSAIAKLVIHSVIASLELFKERELAAWEQPVERAPEDEVEKTPEEKTAELSGNVHKYFNIFLVCVLVAWLLNLWGYQLPFAQRAMKAIFQTFVMVSLALICWRYASKYIEKKIEEATPKDLEKKEDSDDEFGGAAPRGRSHTLLPMVRKVVATALIVMVTMVVISSFGVDIGPLLAGAGVLGLAIGFGAQKLVSDVLSGFFFLLDDAFRVGEYIQAGSMKGTVEAITLRNVLLRHHLGMLQVVPHSDLGAITNFMRGGIVVRFPLEFPYDTDIDKVRKIIKKVGQAMLTDPEIEDDFILPVKSQGVYEITNSVMVIRVKFTAKPGKQFLIRREAYRRITEALNAKGIYYAHRKVIVDFPEGVKPENVSPEDAQKIALAGAASAQTMQGGGPEEDQDDHNDNDMR